LCTLVPSLWLRKPVMVAWSTPGAAVLATANATGSFSMADAVGAFMLCAVAITAVGCTGWFERVLRRIPMALASALLAGVLARFALSGFTAAQTALPLVLTMLLSYLVTKRFVPRYAVPLTLVIAIVFVAFGQGFTPVNIELGFAVPVFIAPTFSLAAAISLALPLFIVTMASQNLPGIAAIQACGFGDQRPTGGTRAYPSLRSSPSPVLPPCC
jgi:benzoate membrane transport protein